MVRITLTPEQEAQLRAAKELVALCDSSGNVVGHVVAESAEISEVWRRLAGAKNRVPTDEVAEHLRALEAEWARTGGFDAAYAREFVAKLRHESPP